MLYKKLSGIYLFVCSSVCITLVASSACRGVGSVEGDHFALIDTHWILSTSDHVPGHIRIGDHVYPVARSVELGDVSLARLSYPVCDALMMRRSYGSGFSGNPLLTEISPENLLKADTLQGFTRRIALDNDSINAEIIKDALSEESSPLLDLPDEVLVCIMASGSGHPVPLSKDRVVWREVNKRFNGIANDSLWVVLKDKTDLERYLKNDKIKNYPVYRIKVAYPITDEEFSSLVHFNPHITDLKIVNCINLMSGEVISELDGLRRIEFWLPLHIQDEENTNKFLAQGARVPVTRVYIDEKCKREHFQLIVSHWPRLKELYWTCGRDVTAEWFQLLPQGLVLLNLDRSFDLTNAALEYLPASLTELSLGGCRLITDEGLQSIAERCKRLKKLHLYGCNVTVGGIKALKERIPGLVVTR